LGTPRCRQSKMCRLAKKRSVDGTIFLVPKSPLGLLNPRSYIKGIYGINRDPLTVSNACKRRKRRMAGHGAGVGGERCLDPSGLLGVLRPVGFIYLTALILGSTHPPVPVGTDLCAPTPAHTPGRATSGWAPPLARVQKDVFRRRVEYSGLKGEGAATTREGVANSHTVT